MGQQYSKISAKLKQFIEDQKMFFVGTATADSRVNISPKGMDSLKVPSDNSVILINRNKYHNKRMTILNWAMLLLVKKDKVESEKCKA